MSTFLNPVRLAKVTGTYHWREDARFDHEYYESAHARLTTHLLAPLDLVRFECDRTVGPGPWQPGIVVATSNAYFQSVAAAHEALSRVGAELAADLPNYTNIRPVLHVSEVLAHAR
ncbi:EthD family reductase [Piscinibacter defluvii]|uniref:EthD family reductase n=1 Tax=Piscinibacter defluvii TaxID=1796922 RepID=UPI000FDE6BE4